LVFEKNENCDHNIDPSKVLEINITKAEKRRRGIVVIASALVSTELKIPGSNPARV
jgi:hypothetical protein